MFAVLEAGMTIGMLGDTRAVVSERRISGGRLRM